MFGIFGGTIYWINTVHNYSNYAGLTGTTFTVSIDSNTTWSGSISGSATQSGFGSASFTVHGSMVSAVLQKQTEEGYLTVTILKDGTIVDSQTTYEGHGVVDVSATS